jgi:transcriptional regulator with XRE-family HTH domain
MAKRLKKKSVAKVIRFRDTHFLKKLGARVKKLRTAKGFSIDRIYLEGEGLNRSSISRIERGLTDPQISTLKRIADTIGISLVDLIGLD